MQSQNDTYEVQLKKMKGVIRKGDNLIGKQEKQIDILKDINTNIKNMLKEERKYSKKVELEREKLAKLKEEKVEILKKKAFLGKIKYASVGILTGILIDQIFIK